MRFLLAVVVLLMAFALIFFSLQNSGTRVPVTLLDAPRDVELPVVVFAAFLAGAIVVGVLALAEGGMTRLANRRLRREVHKLETEVNYLRTQPRARLEPDAPPVAPPEPRSLPAEPELPWPSAPVYDAAAEEEPEDDMYTGGRAV